VSLLRIGRVALVSSAVLALACSKARDPQAPGSGAKPVPELVVPTASATAIPVVPSEPASESEPAVIPSGDAQDEMPAFAPSFEAARGRNAVYGYAPTALDDLRLEAKSVAYLHAYSDCQRGAGIQITCEPTAHIWVELLDEWGKTLPLNEPGAQKHRAPWRVELWSPDSCSYFFVEIKNGGHKATTCDLVLSALVYGP